MAGKYILNQTGQRINDILNFFNNYTFDPDVKFPQYVTNRINESGTVGGNKTFTGKVYIPGLYITSVYSYTDNQLISIPNGAGTNDLGFFGHLIPRSNGSGAPIATHKDLGTISYKWRDLHLGRNLTDGTNTISVDEIVNNKANKIDILPSFTVATSDNIYNFYTENNLEGKSFIFNMTNFYKGVTGFLQAGQPGTPHISFTFILHDGSTIYQGSNVEAENLTFSDAFNNIYKKEIELKNNKVTSISASSTDAQYPSAKAVYNLQEGIENTKADKIGPLPSYEITYETPLTTFIVDNNINGSVIFHYSGPSASIYNFEYLGTIFIYDNRIYYTLQNLRAPYYYYAGAISISSTQQWTINDYTSSDHGHQYVLEEDLTWKILEKQAMMSFIATPLINQQGKLLTSFSSESVTVGGYDAIRIKTSGGSYLTENQAATYMAAMTGSRFVPKYNYDRPQYTVLVDSTGQFYKPQYDATNGLLLYKVATPYATQTWVQNNTTKLYKHNIELSGYPTISGYIINSDGTINTNPTQPSYASKSMTIICNKSTKEDLFTTGTFILGGQVNLVTVNYYTVSGVSQNGLSTLQINCGNTWSNLGFSIRITDISTDTITPL